ncbi:MAG: ImmA/IrrE family metallo-endopeptidase [Oscillospiraceae bacterium]
MTKSKQTALELVQKYNTRSPEQLCALLSIKVMQYEMTDNIHGFYAIIKNKQVIYLDINLEPEQKSQVLAHELGHVLLHGEKNLLFLSKYTLFVPSRYEREADLFAAYLLTDKERLSGFGYNVIATEQLAAMCGISLQMAEMIAEDTQYLLS